MRECASYPRLKKHQAEHRVCAHKSGWVIATDVLDRRENICVWPDKGRVETVTRVDKVV